MHFLWFIIIGAVAGWLSGKIMRGSGFGLLGDLLVGIAGGVIGGWLGRTLGFSAGGSIIGQLITAVVGAIVLLWVIRLFKKA